MVGMALRELHHIYASMIGCGSRSNAFHPQRSRSQGTIRLIVTGTDSTLLKSRIFLSRSPPLPQQLM